jgi:transposase
MEHSQRHPAHRPRARRWPRPPVERPPQSLQRHPLDFANRRALGRSARSVWFTPDRAPALPELGEVRRDGASADDAGATSQGRWRAGFEGVLCGRNFCSGQKRGRQVGKTKRGKGTKIMGIADGHGLPLALRTESASPAEVKLVPATLEARIVAEVPERLIGDKAYDSDRMDEQLMQNYGTELIAPNKINRRVPTQDGRPLRRYRKRWKIERLFAWLFNFRRLVVRYEYHAENFQGLVHLAAAVILLRHL